MGPPLEPVEVLPNVQYSFGNLAHAGPLRVRKNRSYVYCTNIFPKEMLKFCDHDTDPKGTLKV
jgi:hypothetical protein